VLRKVRRGFFCNVALHSETRILGPESRYLHLIRCDRRSILRATLGTAQLASSGLAHPVAQTGFGDAQGLGHGSYRLPNPNLPHAFLLKLQRVFPTPLLIRHFLLLGSNLTGTKGYVIQGQRHIALTESCILLMSPPAMKALPAPCKTTQRTLPSCSSAEV